MKVRKLLAMLLVLSMVLSITLPTAVLAAEGDGADVTVTETTESTGTESTDSTEPGTTESGTTESGTTETGDSTVTVPDESENPAPAPSESTDPAPAPSESTDPTPVPSESTDPTPTPSESTDPAPTPSESTDPTPVPSESTVPAPTETVEIPEATVPGAALCEHGNDPTICPECNPDLYCEHGVLLTEECAQCIAAQQAHEAAMAVAKSVYEKIMAATTLEEYAAAKVVDPMYQSSIDALLAEYVATLTEDQQAAYAAQIEMLEALIPTTDVEAIYNALLAAETLEAFENILAQMSDQELADFVAALTEEQDAALDMLWTNLRTLELETVTPAENYDIVAPIEAAIMINQTPMLRMARSAIAPLSLDGAPSVDSDDEDDGLILNKKVEDVGNNTYKVTLEAWTTGVVTAGKAIDYDIVLVLDMSTSMQSTFYYNYSRMDALKTAATTFVEQVADQNSNHRIAVVGFHDEGVYLSGTNANNSLLNVTENESALKNSINGIDEGSSSWWGSSNGDLEPATDHNDGLELAEEIFDANPLPTDNSRKRLVVMITDGEPEPLNSGDWSAKTVHDAIEVAYRLKNDNQAAVYTVSVMPGSSATGNTAMDNYMRYLSSSYPYSRYTGNYNISRGNRESENTYENRVVSQITPGQQNTASGSFYLTAGDIDTLESIFGQIGDQIENPSVELGANASVRDTLTPYFNLPQNTSDVTVQTADYDGSSFGTPTTATGVTVNFEPGTEGEDGGTVVVTGFDFDSNYVTDEAKTDGTYGKKLIITFTITPDPDFWGGNQVPTNVEADSGVMTGQGNMAGTFPVPAPVDVPLKEISVTAKDLNLYYGSSLPTADSEYYNAITVPIDWRTDYVNRTIVYSVDTSDTKNTEDSNFTVTATLSPKYTGTYSSVYDDATGNVYVFTPIITLGDLNTYLTEEPSYPVTATNVTWQHKTATGTIYGTEPDLSLTCTPDSDNNYTSAILTDYYVDVTQVTSGSTVFPMTGDYAVQFEHSTSCLTGCTFDSTKGQFMVHVFQPVIEFQDIKTYLGNTMDGDDYTASNPTVAEVWKWGDVKSTDVTMQGTKPATDDFGYTYDNGASKVATEDYHVSVQVELNGQELEKGTHYTVSHKDCTGLVSGQSCGFSSANGDFMVHVFKPTITFQDSTIYKGETGELNFKTENYVKTVWKHEKFSGALTGNAPDLTFTYDQGIDKSGYSKDTPVNVTEVKNGSNELDLDDVTFDWQRGGCDCTVDQTGNAEFIVHVKTCTLTVTKSFADGYYDENDTFLFTVSSPNGYETTFTLGTGAAGTELKNTVTLTGLAVGTYTVTENDKWSWRYTATGEGDVTLDQETPDGQITITNELKDDQWLTYDGSEVNNFTLTPAESLVSTVMTALVPEKPKLPGDQDADNEERS